eukprot:SAG11_NODE_29_length_23137_cov_16.739995_7_plen_87_part_00
MRYIEYLTWLTNVTAHKIHGVIVPRGGWASSAIASAMVRNSDASVVRQLAQWINQRNGRVDNHPQGFCDLLHQVRGYNPVRRQSSS